MLKRNWLGELGEQNWRLNLSPRQVLRLIEENTDVPFSAGGALFSQGKIVSRFDGHDFRLSVTSIVGARGTPIGKPALVGSVTATDDGCLLTFRIEFPLGGAALWMPPTAIAFVLVALYAAYVAWTLTNGEENGPDGALCGLFCLAVPLLPLGLITGYTILSARSMSDKLSGLMNDLFRDARVHH